MRPARAVRCAACLLLFFCFFWERAAPGGPVIFYSQSAFFGSFSAGAPQRVMLGHVLLYHAAIPPSDSGGGATLGPWLLRPGEGIADGDYDDEYRDPAAAFSLSRHRPRLSAWNEPPDSGTFPKVVIAGMGKCGTNALAEALARLGFDDPSLTNRWVQEDEKQRQGFSGEVNWQCSKFATHEGLADYRRLFSPEKANWMDKSTSYMSCAHNVSSSLPNSLFFVMLCDPVMAIWSRMNHLRDQNVGSSDPDQIMKVIDAKLKSPPQRNCDVITRYDMSLRPQLEVCYQLDAGLRYAEQIGDWLREAPGRVRFIISEASDADPGYMMGQAATFLGKATPDNIRVGSVHSHVGQSSYLEARGPQWDSYLSAILPLLRPVMQEVNNLALTHDAVFFGEKVAAWWPSMADGIWTKQQPDNQKADNQQHMDGAENRPGRQRRRQRRRHQRREEAGGEDEGEGEGEGEGGSGEVREAATWEVAVAARAEAVGERAAEAASRVEGDARIEAIARIEAAWAAWAAEAEGEARKQAEARIEAVAAFRPAVVRIEAATETTTEVTTQAVATAATAAAAEEMAAAAEAEAEAEETAAAAAAAATAAEEVATAAADVAVTFQAATVATMAAAEEEEVATSQPS